MVKSTHSVSESDSPTTDRFLCGSGGVLGYWSLINTDRDLFFCSRLFGLFFGGLFLRVYGGLSMLWCERPSSIATLLTGEPSCLYRNKKITIITGDMQGNSSTQYGLVHIQCHYRGNHLLTQI